MKRIGILGGTFNPIHIGHLCVAQAVYEKVRLDKVVFVPSNKPPHKAMKGLVDADLRYQMVRLAVKKTSYFEASDFEIKREGKSYSIDTVKHLKDEYKGEAKLFFIIGGDGVETLHKWRQIDELQSMVSFVAVNRQHFESTSDNKKVRSITMPRIDISSSYVRQRIGSGKSVDFLLPRRIIRFIEKHQLYKTK